MNNGNTADAEAQAQQDAMIEAATSRLDAILAELGI